MGVTGAPDTFFPRISLCSHCWSKSSSQGTPDWGSESDSTWGLVSSLEPLISTGLQHLLILFPVAGGREESN